MKAFEKHSHGLYGILTESFMEGRSVLEVAKEMIYGGVKTIQYREKAHQKSKAKMLEECKALRELTRNANVCFIVNDHIDIAQMVFADGVHVGQDDLPVAEIRDLVGSRMIIGLSTHSPKQALVAKDMYEKGIVDYIGVGPVYATQTKEDVCDAVGLEYVTWVSENLQNSDLPFVAIGGIKENNLEDVIKAMPKTEYKKRWVCMVTEILGAKDIEAISERVIKNIRIYD